MIAAIIIAYIIVAIIIAYIIVAFVAYKCKMNEPRA